MDGSEDRERALERRDRALEIARGDLGLADPRQRYAEPDVGRADQRFPFGDRAAVRRGRRRKVLAAELDVADVDPRRRHLRALRTPRREQGLLAAGVLAQRVVELLLHLVTGSERLVDLQPLGGIVRQ